MFPKVHELLQRGAREGNLSTPQLPALSLSNCFAQDDIFSIGLENYSFVSVDEHAILDVRAHGA